MKRFLSLLCAVAAPFVLVACGGGAEMDDSPEADAVRYRQGVMRAIEWKVIELRAMADGDTAVDEAQFKESSHELAALATMITEGFGPGTDIAGSAAKPEVWSMWDEFVAEAGEFDELTQSFAATAEQSGFEAAKAMAAQVGQSCRGCHSPYREGAQ
jgi:cytochrome c556